MTNAEKGQIIDATIVSAPKQRNSREENMQNKEGETPESWDSHPHKKQQKDTYVRWTKKRNVSSLDCGHVSTTPPSDPRRQNKFLE